MEQEEKKVVLTELEAQDFIERLQKALILTGSLLNDLALEIQDNMKEDPYHLRELAESRKNIEMVYFELNGKLEDSGIGK